MVTTAQQLKKLPDWKLKCKKITRLFVWEDFVSAMKFVGKVAKLAEQVNHHPDISVSYNKVHLTLWSHDVGGLSKRDFSLASKIDGLVSGKTQKSL
jgi:4a-hydroxytetrahydrobiopterin dehydratase